MNKNIIIFCLSIFSFQIALFPQELADTSNSLTQETGDAVYYADYFQGKPTSLGEPYDKYKLTCAHKTLPLGTLIKVTRLDTNQSVTVRVNDRGPFDEGVIVDMSWIAAKQINLVGQGRTKVKIEVVGNSSSNPTITDTPTNIFQNMSDPTFDNIRTNPTQDGSIQKFPEAQTFGFAVQISSYTSKDNAIRYMKFLQKMGLNDIYLKEETDFDKQTTFKIFSKIYNSRIEAADFLERVIKDYQIDGYIRELE